MIECICINSANKPNETPLSKWIQEGFKYHITHVYFHPNQKIQGVDLREVKLGDESKPYETYKLSRFAIDINDISKLIYMIQACTDLDYIDIEKLIKETGVLIS